MSTDEDLLEAWRSGDAVAGQALFQRYFSQVQRFFRNKAEGEADDLVATTFERCVAGRDRFQGKSTFKGYLFGIARNVLREHYRRGDRYADFDVESAQDMGCGPSTMMREREEQRLLLAGLRAIPMAKQILLELYYWEDLTAGEISEALGILENTVRGQIFRGKEALVKAIERASDDPALVDRTTANLDEWASSLREDAPEKKDPD